jgi:RNA polymerase sigma-70 factor (ECF subfamily)
MPPKPVVKKECNQIQWFAEEVQSHEPALRSYLRNSFPVVRDVDDVVQESFLRVWRERGLRPVRYAKALLFKVARHLAIDHARHHQISPEDSVGDFDALPVMEDRSEVVDAVNRQEKSRLLAEAIDRLPSRCREIVILRKLHSLPQREVAMRLGISEKTVESQLARGLKRCESYLRKRGIHQYYNDAFT